jgi:predicted nucleic acid-binding protein
MQEAIVDSNVVFGARMKRDQYHEQAKPLVEAMDEGNLPQGIVTNYGLPEILNPIQKKAGDVPAKETLQFLTESGGFRIRHLAQADFTRGRALYKRTEEVEITDTITVAYMQRQGLEYIYSFDDDFDEFDDITRLNSDENPFA